MIEINERIFQNTYSEVKNRIEKETNEEFIDFKTNKAVIKWEGYKSVILKEARNNLFTKKWNEYKIGDGQILATVKKAIKTNSRENNLIDWRKKDNFSKLTVSETNEKFLFDFFKNKTNDETAFQKFQDLNFSYQLIAYLFFIKNPQKYMPISQARFDDIFNSLEIDFKTSYNCSWDNYLEYNNIIKSFRKQLALRHENIELLDAHSFIWIYGFQFEKEKDEKTKVEKSKEISKQNTIEPKNEYTTPDLEYYQPKINVDLDNLTETELEIDYQEQYKKHKEIGDLAEEIVLNFEIEYLRTEFPYLAKDVRSVANNPKLGFDILSFEKDGTQKQIEVKAISQNNNKKSFILTRNELQKSKKYANYYIYCVTDVYSDKPQILRIKNPDLENINHFKLEPLTYQVSFE